MSKVLVSDEDQKLFWLKVQVGGAEECWLWLGAPDSNGCGVHKRRRRHAFAHRLSFELTHGPIPAGMVVMHTCDNRLCVNPNHLQLRTVESRFWAKVQTAGPDECWLWLGSILNHGHGAFRNRRATGESFLAHRTSYEIANGPIPPGQVVRHTCDNKRCVNPAHMILGTQRDNMRDAEERLRFKQGEAHPVAKLTAADVKLIRNVLKPTTNKERLAIAGRLGVAQATVNDVVKGRTWKAVA